MAEQRPNTTSIFHRDVVLVSLGACALVFAAFAAAGRNVTL
ncbi:hypothetical protein ACQQCD_07905 [Pseudarthrobacter sp. J1763]